MSAAQGGSGASAGLLMQLRLFFIALQFFTRLPIPAWVGFEPEWLHRASRYFSAVGIVVGALAALAYLAASLVLPHAVAVLLSVIAGIVLTGAFHEDGFADTCDGFGGGATPERVLAIMSDSRVGAYGAIGIVLMLALKCGALIALPPELLPFALLLAHPWSRVAATALIWRLDYVKGEGKAKPLAQSMSAGEFATGFVSAAIPLALIVYFDALSWQATLLALLAATASAVWLARQYVRRIGGYTGDCLGAVQQLSEVAIYLAILAAMQ